jgi:hypothetical protein
MIQLLRNSLFGCSHQHTTFPFTPRRGASNAAPRNGTYVACLDCGQEFAYDWKEMRLGAQVKSRVVAPQTQPSFR